jgi:hypothetical protein
MPIREKSTLEKLVVFYFGVLSMWLIIWTSVIKRQAFRRTV